MSMVVPPHNEADNIGPLFKRLRKAFDSPDEPYEIVCIDDGSPDASVEGLVAY